MFRKLILLCVLLGFATVAAAGTSPGSVRKAIESSLRVSGKIDITAEGNVVGYTLDRPEKLPEGVTKMIDKLVPQWKFEPVALAAGTVARSDMDLLFIAKKLENDSFSVTLASAHFSSGNSDDRPTVATRPKKIVYPMTIASAGVPGTVYLFLKVGRDGRVAEIDADHVNLRIIDSEHQMERWRKTMANACIEAVKTWTFKPPVSGPEVDDDAWYGIVAVDFRFDEEERRGYGQWQTYVAGPRKIIPWREDNTLAASDAMPTDSFQSAKGGRRLLTPLSGS